jgi:O-acetyl-ADP-ribose deacetylase (regulator of RNase III)
MNREYAKTHLTPTTRLELVQGDITIEPVDAIVNAANARLAHGGGLAGVIARKGGPQIQAESDAWVREHGPVDHARPAYTSAGDLPARFVIHAVGPVWGSGQETNKLHDVVNGALALADQLALTSIAVPAISTGIFGFPLELAAQVILKSINTYFRAYPDSSIELVRMVLFDQRSIAAFMAAWKLLGFTAPA